MNYSKTNSQNRGFASVVIILVVIVIALAAVGYVILKGSDTNYENSFRNLYNGASPTLTPTPTPPGLDKELDNIDDTDPTGDFSDVDKDISNL